MSDLKGKGAVVTGASKATGAPIAKSLSAAGASVMVNCSSSKPAADRVVAGITAKGGKAIETKKAFDRLDVLVNNAGVYKFAPLEKITEDEFHRVFNINVLGTILVRKL
jgi:3-oxoacyl-[acyl-carrier protein] reductase